jgi:hypothetical protein
MFAAFLDAFALSWRVSISFVFYVLLSVCLSLNMYQRTSLRTDFLDVLCRDSYETLSRNSIKKNRLKISDI